MDTAATATAMETITVLPQEADHLDKEVAKEINEEEVLHLVHELTPNSREN